MNEKFFYRIIHYFKIHPRKRYLLHFTYKGLPLVMLVAYPSLLVYAYFWRRETLLDLILVPLFVLIGVSLIRILFSAERPYERYGSPSVFHKDTVGKSFPSRHTASAFIIAMAFLYVNIPAGIIALLVATLILLSRIFSGAHYIRDVVGGMVISVAAGIIFFFLI